MPKTLGCVVMAAGNARRFGENKLAAELDGRSLIRRALEAVPGEEFKRVAVVTQYPEVLELAEQFRFSAVRNEHRTGASATPSAWDWNPWATAPPPCSWSATSLF